MAIYIYNTLIRKKELFIPLKKTEVGIYVCGPTVYDESHIGHARSSFIFEYIRNYFEYKGFKVKLVKNITDIDDKIIQRAQDKRINIKEKLNLRETTKSIAKEYLEKYHRDMELLKIRSPDIEPKATEAIPDMIKMIKILIKKNFAYEISGNIYFDVKKFKNYGKLSGQSIENLRHKIEQDKTEKKDLLDFALWKKAKVDEPYWISPWGRGRAGWHIECSVMSTKYLGKTFDIHCGGIDLIFPHHENEIAQSEAASSKKFARYWIHNGLLSINNEKMSKSLRNFVSIQDVAQKFPMDSLKFFFLSAHYRSPLDFTWDKLKQNQSALNKIITLIRSIEQIINEHREKLDLDKQGIKNVNNQIEKLKEKFEKSMDDDFNTPKAISCIFDIASLGYEVEKSKTYSLEKKLLTLFHLKQDILKLSGIFGLFSDMNKLEKKDLTGRLMEVIIKTRDQIRDKKDYKMADIIRRQLQGIGIILEDKPDKTTWRMK